MAGKPLSEIVEAGWAQALAPVEPVIAEMGEFLRAELAAGRRYLPAGANVLRAFTRPFDEVRVLHEPFSAPFFRVTENLRRTLASGITTVRDAAGADAGLRLAVDEGSLVGPRMQISVTMLSMTGVHKIVDVHRQEAEALAAFGRPRKGTGDA